MSKFKEGDKVRVVCSSHSLGVRAFGEHYEAAIRLQKEYGHLVVEHLHVRGRSCRLRGLNFFLSDQLELVSSSVVTVSSLDYMDNKELSLEDKQIIKEALGDD